MRKIDPQKTRFPNSCAMKRYTIYFSRFVNVSLAASVNRLVASRVFRFQSSFKGGFRNCQVAARR